MSMVAAVTGYALQPPTDPNRIHLLDLPVTSIVGDIHDPEKLNAKTATEMTANSYKHFINPTLYKVI